MTESKTSILYRTLPKLLFFFGLLSIVYLGYTLHLTQQQYGQPQLTVGTEPPPTPYPMFYDPKKLDRKPAADRYLHQFNYNGTVWPFPHDHKVGDDFVPIKGIILAISSDSKQCEIFESAIDRYDRIIQSMISNSEGVDVSAVKYTVKIVVTNCEIKPSPSMDEEYKLVIHKHHGEIKANSEWGMLRALETLAQVISTVNGKPGLVTQQVHDWPEYKHRGLMVDTARHFLPMTILKQLITSLRSGS